MESKHYSKERESWRWNLLAGLSLLIAIVLFVFLLGLPKPGDYSNVTTHVLSVRMGDDTIEKYSVPAELPENFVNRVGQSII